jgi:hypothetical protein
MTKNHGSEPLPTGTEEAREKTRAFLGDPSRWKNVRLDLRMSGPPGFPGVRVSLTGDGRLKSGKTELPPIDPVKSKEIFNLLIEEAFTEIRVGNDPGVPGEILISLELSRGRWRHHRKECFSHCQPQSFARIVAAVQGLVQSRRGNA